jgi:hypothetical protein
MEDERAVKTVLVVSSITEHGMLSLTAELF